MDIDFTITEHLNELRKRVIISLLALMLAAIAAVPFAPVILKYLRQPSGGAIERLVYFGPEEAFLIYIRLSISAGLVLALPVILFQIWAFLSPAINKRLRIYSPVFVLFSFLAFLAGCLFAYFILLPAALTFLLNIGKADLEPVISATRYISFTTNIILACGIIFEMPVVSFFLTRIGVINAGMLRRKYLYAIIVILIAAAVLTPTGDAFNMLMLALPMIVLYEGSIWVSFFSGKREA